ncbi:MAG TPA: hypothetical protein VGT82_15780 [Ktedonobacteraceae bacterium]|nr:hypothetical protein [Ktedonobacteraceae bacterium]
MQKLSLREPKTSAPYLKQDSENIMHFSLMDALPAGETLALNRSLGTLSHITCTEGRPLLVQQQQFTDGEMRVLLPLMEQFPYYCPYEVMFASFYNGNINERTVARCRERLQEAMLEGIWDQEMRPVRNVLSRTRLKMRSFGFDISSILETGYILMFESRPRRIEL